MQGWGMHSPYLPMPEVSDGTKLSDSPFCIGPHSAAQWGNRFKLIDDQYRTKCKAIYAASIQYPVIIPNASIYSGFSHRLNSNKNVKLIKSNWIVIPE